MDLRYVFIGMIALVLFIAMGKSPLDRPDGYVPPDHFKDGIQERIASPNGGIVGGRFGSSTGTGFGSNGIGTSIPTPRDVQQRNNDVSTYGIGGYQKNKRATAGFNSPEFNNRAFPTPNSRQRIKRPSTRPNTSVPTPFQNLPSLQEDSNAASKFFEDAPEIRTSQGKPIKFTGPSVYTLNKKGQTVAMPDGSYYLADGSTMRVVRGKNILPPSALRLN